MRASPTTRALSVLALLTYALLLVSCGGGGGGGGGSTPPTLSEITVGPANRTIGTGATLQLSATGVYSNGTQEALNGATWQTSQPAVATVGAQGMVTAAGVGTTQVSASYQGMSGSTSVTVGAPTVVSIAVSPSSSTLAAGVLEQLTATGTLSDGSTQDLTQSATWSSSASATASVSVTGSVLAEAAGTATISAAVGTVTGSASVTVSAPVVIAFNIVPATLSLAVGSGTQLQAVATLSNGTQQTLSSSVTWQSSASSVITVNPQGYATAVGKGSAQISAAYQALTSNASVTVVAPTLVSLSISPNQVSLPIGETEQLTVTGTYTDGSTQNLTQSVTWISSGPAVSVNAAGSAVAKAAGSATISATIGAVTGTASITVTPAAVVALNIVPGTLTLSLGSSSQLQAVATMSDGSQQTLSSSIAWQSSPTSIVTVNVQGSVTAVGKGSAQVTGTYQGISGSAAVTVVAPSLVSIAITPNQISLPIGETEQLIATGIYTDGSTQNLTQTATWISSGPTVATVSATGSAFAKTIGSATISATVGAVTGTANISVTPAAVVGLNIVPATLTLPLGSSSQLQAVASMSDGTQQTQSSSVTWQTSQPSLATVNPQGVVTGVGKGTVQVSATYQGLTGSASITISPAALVSLTVSPNQVSLPIGETEQFTATGTFTDGSTQVLTQSVSWISSAPAIAPVNAGGAAVAKTIGTVTISAISGSLTGTANLLVTPAAVVALNIVPSSLSLPLGSSGQLQAMASMSDGTTQDMSATATWSSIQPAIATVNAQGTVTATGKGSTQLSATYQGVTGSASVTVVAPALTSVTVTPNQVSLPIGETEQLTATGTYTDGSTQNLTQTATWISSVPTTASVSVTGSATAKVIGTVTISATSGTVTGTASLTVTPAAPVAVNVVPATLSIPLGSNSPLQAIATMSDGTQQTLSSSVTWQTSQSAIATVNPQGVVTAVGKGSAQVSAAYQGLTGNTAITVTPPTLVSVAVSPNQVSLPIGQTEQFTATGTYTDGSTQNLTSTATWISSAPSIASVSVSGSAVAKVLGTATISATSGTVTGTASLTVNNAVPVSVNVVPATLSLALGSGSPLQAIVTYSDGTTQNVTTTVTWSSAQSSIATVNAQGFVTAAGKGTAQVSAAYQGLTGSASITVGPPALVSIAVSPNQVSLPIGEAEQFTATGTYTDGSTQNLTQSATWSSSAPTVATVNGTGSAIAKVLGTATISATISSNGSFTGTANLTVTSAVAVSVSVAPATLSLPLGSTSQLQATATMSDGSQVTPSSVTWQTSQATMATVSAQGLVTAVGKGSVQVSATYQGVTGSSAITVGPAALVSIAVTPTPNSLPVGETEQLTATGTYTDGSTQNLTQTATLTSSAPAIASVNASGSVVAKAVGTATFTAASGSVTGTASLTVTPAVAMSVKVVPATLSLPLGSSSQLHAIATMSDGTTPDVSSTVTWIAQPANIATVSAQGVVTAVGKGSAQVLVAYQGMTGGSAITVVPPALVSIAVSPTPLSLPIGETEQYVATGTYTDGSTLDLSQSATWISSAPAIANVGATGSAVAKALGTTTMSATYGVVTGTASLTVTPAAALSVNVVPSTLSLPLGTSGPLQAVANMSDGSQQTLSSSVTWQSSQSTIASVSTQGLVAAKGIGSAQVSATYQGLTGSASITVGPPALVSIAISATPPFSSLPIGETEQFTATGTYTDGSTQNLTQTATWISSAPGVATVNAAGSVLAVALGTTTISATSGSITSTASLTITPAVAISVNVVPATLSLPLGSNAPLQAIANMSDGSQQTLSSSSSVTWQSSRSAKATVNAQGLVSAVGIGSAQVSATYQGLTGSASITVGPAALVSIALTPNQPSVPAGQTLQLAAIGTYTDGSTQDLTQSATWSSSAQTIATINSVGLANGLIVGSTTITAVSGAIQGTTTLTVAPPVLVSIAVAPANPSIIAANTQQFSAAGTYSDGSTQDVTSTATWSSLSAGVATIAPGGLATGVAAGTAGINATVGSVTGSTTLTVTPPVLQSVAVNPGNPSIAAGNTQQFTATGTYNNGTTQDLTSTATWNSSSAAVATIGSAPVTPGLARGVTVGTTTIQATSGAFSVSANLTVTAGFVSTGSPNTAREYHTATMLNNGLVLIAGGIDSTNSPSVSAELYNPATGVFTATGSLNNARFQHTATLLYNGTVLITGGSGVGGNIAVAEIYDPVSGTFTATGSLNTPRAMHSATLLPTGMVLIAGGIDSTNSPLASAELYNPATWSFIPDNSVLNTARTLHTATLLNTGLVLFAGGNPSGAQTSAELYDPVADTFTQTSSLNSGRYNHTATLLNNGLVLMVGGTSDSGPVASAELFDPVAQIFTPTANLNTARYAHTTTLLSNGTALIAGGTDSVNALNSAEIYDSTLGTFVYTGSLHAGRYNHTATLLSSGNVLVVGGQDTSNLLSLAKLFEPDTLTPPNLASIALSPDSPTVPLDTAQPMIAIGTFGDGSTQQLASVTWSSSDTTTASVTSDATDAGAVYAVGGSAATVNACAGAVCGSTMVAVGPPALVSIAVTPANGTTPAGESLGFDAVGTYSDGSTQDVSSSVTWISSDWDVSMIDVTGLATGETAGTVVISATIGNITGTANLTVTPAFVVGLTINPATLFLAPASTAQLQAIATFSDGTTEDMSVNVTWSVQKLTIASVSKVGLVTANQVGSTIISAQTSGFTASTNLTVASISSISVVPATLSMLAGTTSQFQAIATLSDGKTENVTAFATWSSTQAASASVSTGGLVTAVSVGSASILAKVSGITGSATVNILSPSALNIVPATVSMALGGSYQLQAIATLSDGTKENVTATATWSSLQPGTVTVNNAGLLSAKNVGSATIQATDKGITAAANVAVMPLMTVQYYSLVGSQASGSDGSIVLTNTGVTGGNLCAMIYVFDQNQELNECCGCSISTDGVRTLSLVNDLTASPLTGVAPQAGSIEIVSSDPTQNPQCSATSLAPTGQILAWGTNMQASTNGNYATELSSATTSLTSTHEAYLAKLCGFLNTLGSGQGVCTCGTGE